MPDISTKADTIGNLYALRAGLSVASQISDKAKEAAEEISYQEGLISIYNDSLEDCTRLAQEEKDNYLKDIKEQKQHVQKLEKKITEAENYLQNRYSSKKKWLIGITLLLIGSIFLLSAFLIFKSNSNALLVIGGISALIGAGFLIVGLLDWLDNKDIAKTIVGVENDNKKLLATEKNTLNGQLSKQKQLFANIDNKRETMEKSLHEDLKTANNEKKKAEKELSLQQSTFNTLYGALQKQFCSFLDERDWGNVDLILFYYETGRAVDLRDALLQVDMERRNERLIAALDFATKEISRSIERGFGAMKEVVENKFNELNQTILYSAQEISNQLADVAEENRSMRKNMQRIVEISSAQEALQNKMNTSSNQMAEDISYMRQLAHNTYYS